MYYEIHTENIDAHAQSVELLQFHARYLAVRGSRDMPDAADMPLENFPWKKPFLMVLVPEGDGVYRYTHYGSGIVAAARFDLTGRTTAEFGGALGDFFMSVYRRSREEALPIFTIHRAVKAAAVHSWERLVLPVRHTDGQVGFLVYNRPREFEQDFLRGVLDIIPDGIIAVRALREEDFSIPDAAILSTNPAAFGLLGLSAVGVDEMHFRDLLAAAKLLGLWPQVRAVIEERRQVETQATVQGPAGPRHMRVRIAPLGDGALLHFSDITEMVRHNLQLQTAHGLLHNELIRQEGEALRLKEAALTDPLTGVLNRRGFFEACAQKALTARDMTLVLADADHFKSVNDRWGHGVGDTVLQSLASRLQETAQAAGGFAARLGGEEFAMLLPATLQEAAETVESLRLRIALHPVETLLGPIAVTCSFGLAEGNARTIDSGLAQADAALYEAKRLGRNRSVASRGDLALSGRGAAA